MTIKEFHPKDREEWLKLRIEDVTASESAALFGCGYMTKYELWHTKKNRVIANFDSERMKWGRRLEKTIAMGVSEDYDLKIIDPAGTYYSDSNTRMGATPDFFVSCPNRGIGCLQIKNVDSLIYAKTWSPPNDGNIVPDHIEIQVQQEMGMTSCKWGLIGVLVGGNRLVVYERQFYQTVFDKIQRQVKLFWDSIENNNPPEIDYVKDADFISEMYAQSISGKSVDLKDDQRAAELVAMYDLWSQKHKEADEMKKSCKAELLTIIGDAEMAIFSNGKVSAKAVKGSQGTLVTPEMVGTYIGGREGYRGFRLTMNGEQV